MTRSISTIEDVLRLLDTYFENEGHGLRDPGADRWDDFYRDRDRRIPFFRDVPEESLVAWHEAGLLPDPIGRVLDLGCGPGRNAIWLARQGYSVDAIDLSCAAIQWGRERASAANVDRV